MAASRAAVHGAATPVPDGSGTPETGGVSGPPTIADTPPQAPLNGAATPLAVTVPAPLAAPLWNPPVNGSDTPGGTPNGTGTGTPRTGVSRGSDTPAKGVGTPDRNPSDTPAEPRRAKGVGTPLTSGGTPRGTGAVKGAGTPGRDGTDTPAEYPADEVLLPVLRDPVRVPRDPDGTVPVKRVMRLMSVGRNRAIRLLDTAGLTPGTGTGTPDAKGADTPAGTGTAEGSDDDQERHPEPLTKTNGTPQPELIGAL